MHGNFDNIDRRYHIDPRKHTVGLLGTGSIRQTNYWGLLTHLDAAHGFIPARSAHLGGRVVPGTCGPQVA